MERFRETSRVRKERAVLVAALGHTAGSTDNFVELSALAESAGAIVVDKFYQKIHRINPTTYIGKGKADHLAEIVKKLGADLAIFDNDLSPRQIQELEEIIRARVIDRSELILDIFATRARTRQAMLQVELAQLEYTYPRLTRMWSHLDSVSGPGGGSTAGAVGGIGTRGPGEQQLEIDRRLVKKKIMELKKELVNIDKRRVREVNSRAGLFKICLVGYTNAGKSTLLNRLTGADVLVEDRLFATLDTRTKRWAPDRGADVLISDTVGFIRNLPHHLIASFKATLEEAVNADLLIHVVDAANPDCTEQIESVNNVLKLIGCGEKPTLTVLNKIDNVRAINQLEILQTLFPDALAISAKSGDGIDKLGKKVAEKYRGGELFLRVETSVADGRIQSFLQTCGRIVALNYFDGSVVIEAKLGRNQMAELHRLRPERVEILAG